MAIVPLKIKGTFDLSLPSKEPLKYYYIEKKSEFRSLSLSYIPTPPHWVPPPCGISLPTGPLPHQSFQRPLRSVPPSQHRWSRRHNLNVRAITCNFNNIEQNGMST